MPIITAPAARTQAAAGSGESVTKKDNSPAVAKTMPGRNDLVTITNGTNTMTVKFKKAEPLLASQGYTLVTGKGTSV